MNKFNQGWWNCFLSYTNIVGFRTDCKSLAFEQMNAAGVTTKEIDHVLKINYTSDEVTKGVLKAYKEEVLGKGGKK